MSSKLLAVAAAVAATVSVPAAAVTMTGTIAASFIGVSSDTPSIAAGSTLTNTFFSIVGSTTGDFVTPDVTGATFASSPFVATNGSVFSFTSSFGNFNGSVSNVVQTGPVTGRFLTAYALGTFTPLGVYSAFDPGLASLSFSFNQTGVGGAIAGGFSMATPPTPPNMVPEPGSWVLLIAGFGLTGAAMRRRRVAVAA